MIIPENTDLIAEKQTEKTLDPKLVEALEKRMYEKYDQTFKELAKGEADKKLNPNA